MSNLIHVNLKKPHFFNAVKFSTISECSVAAFFYKWNLL